jgi:hypothetical protein
MTNRANEAISQGLKALNMELQLTIRVPQFIENSQLETTEGEMEQDVLDVHLANTDRS